MDILFPKCCSERKWFRGARMFRPSLKASAASLPVKVCPWVKYYSGNWIPKKNKWIIQSNSLLCQSSEFIPGRKWKLWLRGGKKELLPETRAVFPSSSDTRILYCHNLVFRAICSVVREEKWLINIIQCFKYVILIAGWNHSGVSGGLQKALF